MSDQQQIRSVSIEPTPDGYRNLKHIFIAERTGAQEKIIRMEQALEDLETENFSERPNNFVVQYYSLIQEGLEVLIGREQERIAHFTDGIEEIEQGGY